jgi:hypothetical protein
MREWREREGERAHGRAHTATGRTCGRVHAVAMDASPLLHPAAVGAPPAGASSASKLALGPTAMRSWNTCGVGLQQGTRFKRDFSTVLKIQQGYEKGA